MGLTKSGSYNGAGETMEREQIVYFRCSFRSNTHAQNFRGFHLSPNHSIENSPVSAPIHLTICILYRVEVKVESEGADVAETTRLLFADKCQRENSLL